MFFILKARRPSSVGKVSSLPISHGLQVVFATLCFLSSILLSLSPFLLCTCTRAREYVCEGGLGGRACVRALLRIPQFLSVLTLSLYNDNKQAALGLSLRASDNLLFKCSHALPYGDLVYSIQILGEQSSEYRDHLGSVSAAFRVLRLFSPEVSHALYFLCNSLRAPSS